jgi:hypothetical protein
VVFQVKEGSSSTGLLIKGNSIYGDIGQVLNDNDLDALIEVGGEVTNVAIDANTLKWTGSVSSDEQVTGSVITQGILLYGDVNGSGSYPILLKNNVFDTTNISSNYQSAAIFLNTDLTPENESILGSLTSDVLINDETNLSYDLWVANSDDVGNYAADANDYLVVVGEPTGMSVYTVQAASGGSDILYLETGYDYSGLIG